MRFPIDRTSAPACTICDGEASATWTCHSRPHLYACSRCAVEVLPVLIADAVDVANPAAMTEFENVLNRITATYWKAIAARMREVEEVTP